MIDEEPYDPLGHLKLCVKDFGVSYGIYNMLLCKLGYTCVSAHDNRATWASHDGFGILITQAEVLDVPHVFGASGFHHLCIKAPSRKVVDDIADWLTQQKLHIFEGPRNFPEYLPEYYAVFFADPDGLKLEVAHY